MRYLLDTNIILFLILSELDNLSFESIEIIGNNDNQLYVSSIAIVELIQLCNIGKIKSQKYISTKEIINSIENEFFIKMLPFTREHTQTLSNLKIPATHNDPVDHSIIAHAITEKLILVSSDRKFKDYVSQRLLFSFNKR